MFIFIESKLDKFIFIKKNKIYELWNPYNYKFYFNKKYNLKIKNNIIIISKLYYISQIVSDLKKQIAEEYETKIEIGDFSKEMYNAFYKIKHKLPLTCKDMYKIQELPEEILNKYGIEKWKDDIEEENQKNTDEDIHSYKIKDAYWIIDDDEIYNELLQCSCISCKKIIYKIDTLY